MENKRGFASDNNSGVHPEILKSLTAVNTGHTIGYGDDIYTQKALRQLKDIFGPQSSAYLVLPVQRPMCLVLKP